MSINLQPNQHMDYLPITINCRGRLGLVVGGGEIAVPKVRLLLRAGAEVAVVAPSLCRHLSQQANNGIITHIQSHFAPYLLDQKPLLVIAAAAQLDENKRVAQAAREQNIPVNVVDNPALCTFIFPAIVDRSPLSVAISTAGNSPVLARLVREHLEAVLPTGLGQLALFAGRMRGAVKTRLPNATLRRRFWEYVLGGAIAEPILQGNDDQFLGRFNTALNGFSIMPLNGDIAWITIVSSDPELLTLKALRVLQQADVIVYDATIDQAVLRLARRDADTIHVSNTQDISSPTISSQGNPSQGISSQAVMEQTMIRLARSGKRVCRLSNLNPGVPDGNNNAIAALLESGVSFQVIPGISEDRGYIPPTSMPHHPPLMPTNHTQH